MSRKLDILITALAPAIWGSTYLVTTELLPSGYPITLAMLRALPAGLLLLVLCRRFPRGVWVGRIAILGALNFSIFWVLLFVAAYRLPGGVAATLGATQPLIVILLARLFIGENIRVMAVLAGFIGLAGVALLVLIPITTLDQIGILAGLGGALSMAAGTVLSKKWQPDVPLLTFTAWQLTAGGLILLPIAMVFEPALPELSARNMAGLFYLGLIGAAFTYAIWFRGVSKLAPNVISTLGLFSPVVAVLLGWGVLGQVLNVVQGVGVVLVLLSIWLSQKRRISRA